MPIIGDGPFLENGRCVIKYTGIEPGTYKIVGSLEGKEDFERDVTIVLGQEKVVEVIPGTIDGGSPGDGGGDPPDDTTFKTQTYSIDSTECVSVGWIRKQGRFLGVGTLNTVEVIDTVIGRRRINNRSGHTDDIVYISTDKYEDQDVEEVSADRAIHIPMISIGEDGKRRLYEEIRTSSGRPPNIRRFNVYREKFSQTPVSTMFNPIQCTHVCFDRNMSDIKNAITNIGMRGVVQIFRSETLLNNISISTNGTIVTAIKFNKLGERLVLGDQDGNVMYYDTDEIRNPSPRTNRRLFSEKIHTRSITDIDIAENRIASGSVDNTIAILDLSGTLLRRITSHRTNVSCVSLSPDGSMVVSGDSDGNVIVHNTSNGNEIYRYTGHNAYVRGVDWAPDGKKIASCDSDSGVHVWFF